MNRTKDFKHFLLSFLLGMLIFQNIAAQSSSLTIVRDGASKYEIISPHAATLESAEVLQGYLEKISDVKLPIHSKVSSDLHQILLSVESSLLARQEISIVAHGSNLHISGGSPEALRNAVYVFLEKFQNCRWYAPDVEWVPKKNEVEVSATLTYNYNPKIHTRTVHSRLFYDHPEFAKQQRVTSESFPYYVPSARVHTFRKFMPEGNFYTKHPEYYAMRGDKRLPTQLCLTNPRVLEIVKDSVRALFLKHPHSDVISVSTNDNTQYCECENCARIDLEEGSHAGSLIRFVNEVAAEFPDKQVSTLAYQYTRKPCKTAPKGNVLITLCSIECDRSAPIEEKCVDFAEDLRGWKALTENIRIWDYTTQFTNFLAPFPNIHTLQPNIAFFEENNARWIFQQHSNQPSELFELRSYLMAQLLWDPNLKPSAVIQDFTDGYYEEAGPFIKEYVDLIHAELEKDDDFFLFLYGDPSQAFTSYLNNELLESYSLMFDNPEMIVSGKPEVLQRVKRARLGVDHAVLEACRRSMSEKYRLSNESFVSSLLSNFQETCSQADITMMNEMRYRVDEYVSAYKRTMEVAQLPNQARGKPVVLETKPKKYAAEDPQVLTDGAYGGSSFYANWLGFEGNDLIGIVDLGSEKEISSVNTAFLQVTNHVVFFPEQVRYSISTDGVNYGLVGTVKNQSPLEKSSKINDLQYYELKVNSPKARYVKIHAVNMKEAPVWHHAAGLPSWIFADEVIVR